jgi:lycopene beta-cyclase
MVNAMQSPDPSSGDARFDLILVGGGLQNGLIALSALYHNPARRIALIERDLEPGGNHTWCLHADDVPDEARPWIGPLIVHRWAGYDVCFPGLRRTVTGAYSAITSARFAGRLREVIASAPNARLLLGTAVREVNPHSVVFDDGRVLHGSLVVDARGPERKRATDGCGFQKFVGLELEFKRPHGVERPLVMDATIPQKDGYRFFYLLPLSHTRLLVEDTRFSPQPELDREALRNEIRNYAGRFGEVAAELREESGVLPMPYMGERAEPTASPLLAGYRGGFFHPATGYSFPAAVRLAQHLGSASSDAAFDRDLHRIWRSHSAQAGYAQKLNWLLFNGFEPQDMWNVFERFYRLPDRLIHRFYALSLSSTDRARILIGKPPAGFKLSTAIKSTGSRLERTLAAALRKTR